MSNDAINWLIKGILGVFALLIAAGIWYYTAGRKPHVLVSVPVKAGDFTKVATRSIGRDEVLLLVGSKVVLHDLETKRERWSATLSAAAAPAATAAPKIAAKPATTPAPQEKPDPLAAARVKKRFAKLEKWAAELNEKRGKLKTPLQVEAFNQEAAKYHAELTAARSEAGIAAPTAPARRAEDDEGDRLSRYSSMEARRTEVVVLNGSIWIAQGNRLTGLDRTDGHVLKALTLAGSVTAMERGEDELFVHAQLANGRDVQVSRIAAGGATVQAINVGIPPEPREPEWVEGRPRVPAVADHRILFSANHGPLLQLDVRLAEKKLTERQVISGESGSDLEAWDKKSKGGFGDDALAFARAMSRENERDATGGREITDESTYQIALTRPFSPTVAAATAQVHGPAQVFSTPTLDLVAAGKELIAFDHSNKKLWQAQLSQPLAPLARSPWSDDESSSTGPCLEAGDRLYFYDPAYLTAFAKATGQPAWRLPLKGIAKVQLDDSGHLYVSTTSAELGAVSQLFRLDAKSGRVLWKVEKYDHCYVSGPDLYVTRETRNAEDAVNAVFDRSKAIQCRWKLYKLSTRNGEPQWEWFQTRRPTAVEADHKRVSLLFHDELQVLTSIAL